MFLLPEIDYSPLRKKWLPTIKVRKLLGIKTAWLPDSEYLGSHPPYSLGSEEIKRAAQLYQFAIGNNFGFIGNLPGILPFPRSRFHSLATLNFPTMITYGVIMQLVNGWLEVGELRLDDATSNKPQDSRFTYAKITLGLVLPDLTLDSLNAGLPTNTLGKPVYRTESEEFHRHFKLFLDKNQVQAGLKILSPDVMAILIDNFNQFDIEMRDHTISLITYNYDLVDPATLQSLLGTITELVSELSYQVRSPVSVEALPADITSYKKLYGYSRQSESILYKPYLLIGLFFLVVTVIGFAIGALLALFD